MTMKGPRAFCFVFALAALFSGAASAQSYGRAPGANPNQSPIPDKSASPRSIDPEAYDSIDLYSRLCVSTRGDRARAVAIIGNGDSAIEPMDAPLLRGMENGRS